MDQRKFFVTRGVGFAVIIVLAVCFFLYKKYISPHVNTISTPEGNISSTIDPVFLWSYKKDISLNLDGQPNTIIFLEAKYDNNSILTKTIDSTPGSCNDLPESDRDSLLGTINIQCYSAGLGYRFKIIKGEEEYLVLRKTFEESLPAYTPPVYEYEVVASFPFFNSSN